MCSTPMTIVIVFEYSRRTLRPPREGHASIYFRDGHRASDDQGAARRTRFAGSPSRSKLPTSRFATDGAGSGLDFGTLAPCAGVADRDERRTTATLRHDRLGLPKMPGPLLTRERNLFLVGSGAVGDADGERPFREGKQRRCRARSRAKRRMSALSCTGPRAPRRYPGARACAFPLVVRRRGGELERPSRNLQPGPIPYSRRGQGMWAMVARWWLRSPRAMVGHGYPVSLADQ